MRLNRGVCTALALVLAVAGVVNFVWFPPSGSDQGESVGLRFFAVHLLAMVGNAYLLFTWVFPWFMGRTNAETASRVAAVRASGPPVCTYGGAGEIGRMRLSGPLLNVVVHPGGIVVTPFLMADRAIPVAALVSVTAGYSLWNPVVRVRHTAPDLATPLSLYTGKDTPIARALRALLPGDG